MKRKKCHRKLRGIHQRALFLHILYVFSWFFAYFICIKYSEIGKVFTYWYNAYNFQYFFTHNNIVVLKLLYLWSCQFIIGSSVHLVEVGEMFWMCRIRKCLLEITPKMLYGTRNWNKLSYTLRYERRVIIYLTGLFMTKYNAWIPNRSSAYGLTPLAPCSACSLVPLLPMFCLRPH